MGQEALPVGRGWPGGPPEGLGVVSRPSQRVGSGREALPVEQKWLEGPPGWPGVVRRPSRRDGSGWEALLALLEGLPTNPRPLGVPPDHSQPSGSAS